ncbi:MAG: hypothetical protein PHI06_02070 [Desulfobulbaceae bacterium]|nr:hypothetical protein [Desulfobulbaceae bacterium]
MAATNCPTGNQKKILILSYSFSGQTSGLLRQIQGALIEAGHQVHKERITPCRPLKFPTGSIISCLKMMVTTFLRFRVPIQELSPICQQSFDLVLLAGPTWSYNPSGPILALIDRDGPSLFKGQVVLPVISCRGYWRVHLFGLTRMLQRCGASIPNSMVFSHPHKEPWRTIGVFLKISGKSPERWPLLRRYYSHFGHSREQQEEACRFGSLLGQALRQGQPLSTIDFATSLAIF